MMPTFFDSIADAAEASEALRGLAHASRGFDEPAQMYGVIGELSAAMRSLRQVLDQLAVAHERETGRAFDDAGDHEAGVRDALAAAAGLHQAANLVDRAYDRLAEGFVAAGRIAWHGDPAVEESVSRWVSVVFLQGDEADRALRILDEAGPADAVDYLTQWDYGDETTLASLTYGYVYDQPGEGTNDQVMTCGDYALVVNTGIGYVSLLRRYLEPDIEAGQSGPVVPSATRSGVSVPEGSWFQPTRSTGVEQSRGLEL